MFADYVCVCVCVLCLSTTKPIILIHSSRDGIRRLVDRLNVHKATKKGNIVCIRVIPRDDSHEECASFPHCLYLFDFFFVLMSTPRSGLDPPPLAHVWYIDVYYTETLSSVHWRLKYTNEICSRYGGIPDRTI